MVETGVWSAELRCESGGTVRAEVPVNMPPKEAEGVRFQFTEKREDQVSAGAVRIEVISRTLSEIPGPRMDRPVRIRLPLSEKPEKITALYLFNPWWTRPAFVNSPAGIPDRTQLALFLMKDRCVCFLPMVGRLFKSCLTPGGDMELSLEMTACAGGIRVIDEPLYLMAEGPTAREAVHAVFSYLQRRMGLRLRDERRLPEMFRYLGWCSWDAFYTEVSEAKLREKAEELTKKQVPVRWMLIDDGWFGAEDKMLSDFAPDREKFPAGFRPMVEDLKRKTGIRWFGIWHALGGYWDGTAPGSRAAEEERAYLLRTPSGMLGPDPDRGAGFYSDWYRLLREEGIDFVKVDGQSAVPMYYKNLMPLAEAARKISLALESGACRMDGAVINCMGMAMENLLQRPSSAVSRNSDDFLPMKEESFAEHLIQNAWNALYQDEVYVCDWDMFWTRHRHAEKHALLRAVSGGPVYVSDRTGDTDPEILAPLIYEDGEVLLMDRAAKPAEDCIFRDPLREGALKLTNTGRWGEKGRAGGIAVYNLTGEEQTFSLSPADIPGLSPAEEYVVYDYFGESVFVLGCAECRRNKIGADGYGWYMFIPKKGISTCIGLSEKYAGMTAVLSIRREGNTETTVLRESGSTVWYSERRPSKVLCDGRDVTENMISRGCLHVLKQPGRPGISVITLIWDRELPGQK